jgi:hypothetical protein
VRTQNIEELRNECLPGGQPAIGMLTTREVDHAARNDPGCRVWLAAAERPGVRG